MAELHKKIATATKWSGITEIAAKLVMPISTMVLARLLAPEAFGVMVTAVMVISFAEIFTDAGFQKYLIQHKFETREELYKSTNVAFWSNLAMSLLIWAVIAIFCQPIATMVGNEGRGDVIAISCVCIPLAAFSSIQMAIYKRDLDFKTLFLIRMVGVAMPIVVTIPLALITRSYWALIIGMIALQLSNAILLTMKSPWKPKWFYEFRLFKDMFAFSAWSMLEALAIWATNYADIFIVGKLLDEYYLGLYRTSMTTVGQIMGLVTAATTPVLFSSLSKVQDDDEHFKYIFFKFQKIVGLLIVPLGVGIFVFRDLFTDILLGDQWKQAAWLIGLWGLTSSITIVFSHYCSEVFRSKGKPKLSFVAQLIHMAFLIPLVWWAAHIDYTVLCDVRALVRLTLIATNLVIFYYLLKVTFFQMVKNLAPILISAAVMGGLGYLLILLNSNIVLQFVYIVLLCAVYFFMIYLFPKERDVLLNFKKYIKR